MLIIHGLWGKRQRSHNTRHRRKRNTKSPFPHHQRVVQAKSTLHLFPTLPSPLAPRVHQSFLSPSCFLARLHTLQSHLASRHHRSTARASFSLVFSSSAGCLSVSLLILTSYCLVGCWLKLTCSRHREAAPRTIPHATHLRWTRPAPQGIPSETTHQIEHR